MWIIFIQLGYAIKVCCVNLAFVHTACLFGKFILHQTSMYNNVLCLNVCLFKRLDVDIWRPLSSFTVILWPLSVVIVLQVKVFLYPDRPVGIWPLCQQDYYRGFYALLKYLIDVVNIMGITVSLAWWFKAVWQS